MTMEALQKANTEVAQAFNHEQIELIKRTIAKGASDDELKLFLHQCQRTGLDPFARQIYSVARREKDKATGNYVSRMTTQVSIDGFRLVAQRSSEYAGQTPPLWCGSDGVWRDVWLHPEPPAAAKVGVYRKGFSEALIAVARFDSYAQRFTDGNLMGLWAKMPEVMIAKCAEALALRKAFPQELSGLYTSDEMGQADAPPVHVEPKQIPVKVEEVHAEVVPPPEVEPTNGEDGAGGVPTAGDYIVPFGSVKGKKLRELTDEQIKRGMAWCESHGKYDGFIRAAEEFLKNPTEMTIDK